MSTRWLAGGLAVMWFVATALGVLDLPNSVVVLVLGVLVMLSVEPDSSYPERGVVRVPSQPRPGRAGGGAVRCRRRRDGPAVRQGPDRVRAHRPRHVRRSLRAAPASGRDPGASPPGSARSPRVDHRGHRARRCRPRVPGGRAVSPDGRVRRAGAGRDGRATGSGRGLVLTAPAGARQVGAAGRELLAVPGPAGRGRSHRHVLRLAHLPAGHARRSSSLRSGSGWWPRPSWSPSPAHASP